MRLMSIWSARPRSALTITDTGGERHMMLEPLAAARWETIARASSARVVRSTFSISNETVPASLDATSKTSSLNVRSWTGAVAINPTQSGYTLFRWDKHLEQLTHE